MTFLCNFDKVTKPKAQILINSEGTILGNSSATLGVLNLLQSQDLSLRKGGGYSNINGLIAQSGIDMNEILRLEDSSSVTKQQGKGKRQQNRNKKEFQLLKRKQLNKRSTRKDKDHLKDMKKNYSKMKTQKAIKIQDQSFYVNTTAPANFVGEGILIELWRQDTNKAPQSATNEVNESPEKASIGLASLDNSFYTKNSRVSKKSKTEFFFALNHKFEFFGSFQKKFSSRDSNLKFDKDFEPSKAVCGLSASSKLLWRLRNEAENGDGHKIERIDYSEGIRVKRLNKDGNIIDWYEGIDGGSSDSEDDYHESLFFQKRYKNYQDAKPEGPKEFRKNKRLEAKKRNNSQESNPKNQLFIQKMRQKGQKKQKNDRILINQNKSKRRQFHSKGTKKSYSKAQTPKASAKNTHKNQEQEEESAVDTVLNLASKARIQTALEHRPLSTPIYFLIFSIIFMNLCFIIDRTFFTYTRVVISNDLQRFSQIDYAMSFRLAGFFNINSNLIQIALINNGTDLNINAREGYLGGLNPEANLGKRELIGRRLGWIRETLGSFEQFNIAVLDGVERITLAPQFRNFLNKKDIEVVKMGASPSNYSLNECIRQIVATTAGILDLPYNQITFYEPDVYFVLQNCRLMLFEKLIRLNIYSNIIKNDVVTRQGENQLLTIYSTTFIVIANLACLYFGAVAYYKHREAFFGLFYGFGQFSVERVIERCEKYLWYLRAREIDDEDILMISDDSDEEEAFGANFSKTDQLLDLDEWINRLRKKRRKGSLKSWFGLTHLALIGFFGVLMALRHRTYVDQSNIIAESVQILDTVDVVTISEQRMYGGLMMMHYSMYDFGEFGRVYRDWTLRPAREELLYNKLEEVNDRSLKVREIFLVS